jgi:soluble lytic murein transglycosylase-like protein
MRLILTAAAAALLSLALSGCETTGTSNETTGSISSGKIKSSSMSFGYTSRPHGKLISKYAKSNGVPESLAHAVISVESNYRANARGAAGEVGLMQIKPATARMMGYKGSTKALYDPETNIKYGMKYLAKAHQLGGGTTCGTILKYNAGHGAKRMNPVSKRYCGKVAKLMK